MFAILRSALRFVSCFGGPFYPSSWFREKLTSSVQKLQQREERRDNGSGIRKLRYVNNSYYKNDTMIAVVKECRRIIAESGHADNSFKVISPDGAKTLEIAFGHCAPVTCLALSSDSKYLVTGSRDATVLLWRIHDSSSHSISVSESISGSGTPSTNNNISSLVDKSRRRRIEGPVHVLGVMKKRFAVVVSAQI